MKVALKTIRDVRAQFESDMPYSLTSDFNSVPKSGDACCATVADGLLSDVHTLEIPAQRFGPKGTSSGAEQLH